MKKICKYCGNVKTMTEFHKDRDGISSICKSCYKSINEKSNSEELMMKVCENCYYNLPVSNFNKSNKTEDGYSNVCRVCKNNNDIFNKDVSHSYIKLVCKNCKQEKEASEFYRKKDEMFIDFCKDCIKEETSDKKRKKEKKRCYVCGEVKTFSILNFPVDINRNGFLKSRCRECKR